MNGHVHWNPVAVIAVIAVLVAGYWLLPQSGWGRIGCWRDSVPRGFHRRHAGLDRRCDMADPLRGVPDVPAVPA
jgi:hypothetical protein